MLNAHPEIGCVGEGHFTNHLAQLMREAVTRHNEQIHLRNETVFQEFQPFPDIDDEQFRYLTVSAIALSLMRADSIRHARVAGEKTPDNICYFNELENLFPHAKFLHVVRDGRDAAVSAWFHRLRTDPQGLLREYGDIESFVTHIAQGWAAVVEHGLAFGAARPGRCMVVHYRDLFARSRDTVRAVLAFLNVDASETAVQRCIASGAFEKISNGRPAGVENRSSFVRQGLPGDWFNHLSPEANSRFLATAGGVMKRAGYQG
jgi:hypothetical protein